MRIIRRHQALSFEEGGDAYIVKFDMVSMKIDPDESSI
jgi:hypothetical protein